MVLAGDAVQRTGLEGQEETAEGEPDPDPRAAVAPRHVEEEQEGQASPVVPVLAASEVTAGPSVTLNTGAWGGAVT